MQTAFAESFNGSLRDELLNETLFLSLSEAREKIGAWREELQPHKTPLIPWQSHAAGVCTETETRKQGCMRPEINRRALPKAGAKPGLRSGSQLETPAYGGQVSGQKVITFDWAH